MKELKKFIKTTGIYLIGNVLTKAVSFIMLPIYTKYLSTSDYGTYDVNIAYITFLSSVLFLDIWSGMMRYMFDFDEKYKKSKPIISGCFIFFISTIGYTVFTFIIGSMLSIAYLGWVYLFGLLTNVQMMLSYIVRGYQKNTLFAVSGLLGSSITAIFNVIFIGIMHGGYQYLYIASIIGMGMSISVLLLGIDVKSLLKKENFDKKMTWSMFVFSLPLTVNSVSWWFLTAFNRVMLSNRLSVAENGLYAVANKFSTVMQLVDQAFQMAWQEISFSKSGSQSKDQDVFFSEAINQYIKFMSFGVILLLPVVKIVFPYFINAKFHAAFFVVPLALIATLFSSISSFLGSTLTAIKQNRYLFTTTLSGTVVNVIVIFGTIDTFKVQAASLALAAGYLVVDIRRYRLLKKYMNIHINIKSLLSLLILTLVSVFLYQYRSEIENGVGFFILFFIVLLSYRENIRKFLSKKQ